MSSHAATLWFNQGAFCVRSFLFTPKQTQGSEFVGGWKITMARKMPTKLSDALQR